MASRHGENIASYVHSAKGKLWLFAGIVTIEWPPFAIHVWLAVLALIASSMPPIRFGAGVEVSSGGLPA